MTNRGRILLFSLLIITALSGFIAVGQQPTPPRIRYTEEIEAFEKSDREMPPPTGSILFVGSSIFRLWKGLAAQMAPLPVFNRAFGGSRTHEILAYLDRIVLPYRPRLIVYYCGSNDINANVSPVQIAANFKEFVVRVQSQLPDTRIVFVSINKAPQKRDRWSQVDEANRLVSEYCTARKGLLYVDVNPALFDSSGEPRMELYLPDNLHFRDQAYLELADRIKPTLDSIWKEVAAEPR
ncbi:MAG: hypothetical protein EBU88_09415 [Acidobacteria bacterium]|nr:hypothetical protein [Acidobacteriota bacterium]